MARRNKGVRAVLLGPDTKHGAEPRKGFLQYKWYAEFYERGKRRLRTLNRVLGEDYQDVLESVRHEFANSQSPERGAFDAKVGVILHEYAKGRIGEVFRPRSLISRCRALGDYFGKLNVSQLTISACEDYARTRPSQGTARIELGTLKSALIFGRDRQLFAVPIPKLWKPKEPQSRERVYTRQEIARIVRRWRRSQRTRHLAVATLIAYYTGARIGSVLSLRWSPSRDGGWIDLAANRIHFKPLGRAETKKRKPTVIIPIKLRALLVGLSKKRRELVCDSDRGGCNVNTFGQAWARCFAAEGITKGVPHSLRHSRITHMISGGVPIAVVSLAMGVDAVTLMRRYAHLQPGHGEQAAQFRK